jgi:hypothetical protein
MSLALTQVHRQRLGIAVCAVLSGKTVILQRERTEFASQRVWYDGRERHVILAGDGIAFDALAKLARQEFQVMCVRTSQAPEGVVLERGAKKHKLEALRR